MSITCCACQILSCHRGLLIVISLLGKAFPWNFHRLFLPIFLLVSPLLLPIVWGLFELSRPQILVSELLFVSFTTSNNRKVLLIWFITSVIFPQFLDALRKKFLGFLKNVFKVNLFVKL